jgi:predicted metal-dependent enzyme (double-stranded beta helix superfamily)
MNPTLRSKVQSMALDFYQGNIGAANSKYFSILDELSKYEPFVKNAKNVLKMQENEDWVGLGDFFCEKM